MPGTVYEMYSPNCNRTYIGSTIGALNLRLNSHRNKKHPIFAFADVSIRPLLENVPIEELRKKEGELIRQRKEHVFNKRVAGRTAKEKYWENIDASREYHRNRYTPKKYGGDGNYRQLQRYLENKYALLRSVCIKNAKKNGRLPTQTSQNKYNFTDAELDDIKKHIQKAKDNEPSPAEN